MLSVTLLFDERPAGLNDFVVVVVVILNQCTFGVICARRLEHRLHVQRVVCVV